jgi:hypothetical protein
LAGGEVILGLAEIHKIESARINGNALHAFAVAVDGKRNRLAETDFALLKGGAVMMKRHKQIEAGVDAVFVNIDERQAADDSSPAFWTVMNPAPAAARVSAGCAAPGSAPQKDWRWPDREPAR